MAETPAISDRNLEATTNISLKREPACFAFLSARSVSPPMPIDSINLDLASADYFQGRASLWTTLEMRSSVNNDRPIAILGFDETFLLSYGEDTDLGQRALGAGLTGTYADAALVYHAVHRQSLRGATAQTQRMPLSAEISMRCPP